MAPSSIPRPARSSETHTASTQVDTGLPEGRDPPGARPRLRSSASDLHVEYHVPPDPRTSLRRTALPGALEPELTGTAIGPHRLANDLGPIGAAELARAVAPDGTELWVRSFEPHASYNLSFLGGLLRETDALRSRPLSSLPRLAGMGLDRGRAWVAFVRVVGIDPEELATRLGGPLDRDARASLALAWARAALALGALRNGLGAPFDAVPMRTTVAETLLTRSGELITLEPLFGLAAEHFLGMTPPVRPSPLWILEGTDDPTLSTLAAAWRESPSPAAELSAVADVLEDDLSARGVDPRRLRADLYARAVVSLAGGEPGAPSLDAWTRRADGPVPVRRFTPMAFAALGSSPGTEDAYPEWRTLAPTPR